MAKTIEDLSKLMGISYATISRAMNRPDLVSPKTRKRILEGMREHQIYPNVSARNLKLRQTKILRILVPETANYFYWEFLNAFRTAAFREKYEILLSTYDSAGSALDHSPKGVHTDCTVLIADPGVRDESHIREIESREHSSLILCGNLPVKDRHVVGSDDRAGMSALVDALL
ncbi:MAG: LacI family DNA-binding transcriptional regulator, partial [Spirochaetia bacterium]|nr:LacI family DNA-binding transcriptional regulator [Spirochaetia bacterium]